MKVLDFKYQMKIKYLEPVSNCHFTIKCIPKDTKRQQITDARIHLTPETKYVENIDGLKNKQIYGANPRPHDSFIFEISGISMSGLSKEELEENPKETYIFKFSHGLNKAGDEIKSFFNSIEIPDEDNIRTAKFLTQMVFDAMTYVKNATTVKTSAEEAFSMRKGVCQDYAHILISLLHLKKIPARYVTGFVLGEGESHAWVEFLSDKNWYGIDPTWNRMVDDDYIRIGIGRDANDCMMNRGIFRGNAAEIQEIKVSVKEL